MKPRGRSLNSMNYIYIYIYLIYIYLLLLYNISILDIEHSPYYIALGSTQNPQSDLVTTNTVIIYIYIYIYITTVNSYHYLTWWVSGRPNVV